MRISSALPLAAFVLVATAACGSQTADSGSESDQPKATPTPTEPSSCLDMWDDTREQAVADGQEDGDARRLADDAVAQCLEQATSDGLPTTQAPSQEDACDQPANEPQQDAVDVYYFCAANGTTVKSSHPVDTAPDLQSALTTYFAGPNDAERERGLSAPLGRVLADAQFELSGSDGKYEVSFEPGAADTIGGMATGQSQLFIEGIRRTISQFDAVQSVTLTEAGDCDAFWRAAEMVCNPIERSN